MSNTERDAPDPSVLSARVRPWASRVGGVALIGLGIVHTITNTVAFVMAGGGSWPLFLIFNPGLSLVVIAIGVVSWRESRPGAGRWPARVVVGIGALFCSVTLFNVLRNAAAHIWVPIGPGPWVVVGAPALVLATILPARRAAERPEVTTPTARTTL